MLARAVPEVFRNPRREVESRVLSCGRLMQSSFSQVAEGQAGIAIDYGSCVIAHDSSRNRDYRSRDLRIAMLCADAPESGNAVRSSGFSRSFRQISA